MKTYLWINKQHNCHLHYLIFSYYSCPAPVERLWRICLKKHPNPCRTDSTVTLKQSTMTPRTFYMSDSAVAWSLMLHSHTGRAPYAYKLPDIFSGSQPIIYILGSTLGSTVIPKKYGHAPCFIVFCSGLVMMYIIHMIQGYFIVTEKTVWLPQWQWSNPDQYAWITHINAQRTDNIITT